jgi:diguanylate cyclase (GGDEF)-like protein/PAS domain S-box-containing protein
VPRSSVPERRIDATRAVRSLRQIMPTGGGLDDEDWQGRHRLLTATMVATAVLLTGIGADMHRLGPNWLVTILIIAACTVGALVLPPRRLPSCAVALGLTAACAGLVMIFNGLTEAHFSFFIAVGALALYRDWVPFGVFLAGTVAHHAFMGAIMADLTYDHADARFHPWRWAAIHGVAVLLMALTQVIAWRLTEAEEGRATDDLTRAEAQFSAAFEEAPIPLTMVSPSGVILRVNPAFVDWVGLAEAPPVGATVADLPIKAEQPTGILDRLREEGVDVIREHHLFRHDDGRLIHVDLHASALRDDAGELKLIVTHFLDTTEKHAQEAVLHRRVREDSLTGLLSRGAFEADLVDLIAARPGQVSVIYIDVDRFKVINDSYGHGAGDEVLRALGSRLTSLTPPDALVARLGGDEFAIALAGPMDGAHRLGEAIVNSCAAPLPVVGGHLSVTLSVGLSAAIEGQDAEATLQSADLAMYAAKQTGRDRVKLFDDSMRQATESRVAAEHQLREALDVDWSMSLPVWFQPIVSLSEGRPIVGAEALIRLRTPEGGLVPPGVFIPIAEETGLVVPLGEHVLRTALTYLRLFDDRLPYVSVNVSPRQLSEVGFVPMLVRELEESGLADASRLVLEVTETSVLETGLDLHQTFHAVKALGVRLALDDFGTGYSSLTWLQSVPADIVKLDRSFVAGLATDSSKASIISAVLWLARSLGMSVVAEGVEDVEDADMLAEAGCPLAQGYLFGKPMPPDELATVLAAGAVPAFRATTFGQDDVSSPPGVPSPRLVS